MADFDKNYDEEIVGVKRFEWQLSINNEWQPIDKDYVIEAHYCHPAAKGLTINTTSGRLHIDFETFQTDNPAVMVQRLTFLPPNETETMAWYYRGDNLWAEYGLQSSESLTSENIENHFKMNPKGTLRFSIGNKGYSLDFSNMTQTNLTTSMCRKIRRRPKFKVNRGGDESSAASTFSSSAAVGGHRWEFEGDEGVWTEYQAHLCSYDSARIEALYQQDPRGQLRFKAKRFSYTLDFVGMFQINDSIGTKRKVRRTPLNSSWSAGPRWQFEDIDGFWKDYSQGRGVCSVSSDDIELQFQQNSSGVMNFHTSSFRYELNFADMTQRNLSTNTSRRVRRLDR